MNDSMAEGCGHDGGSPFVVQDAVRYIKGPQKQPDVMICPVLGETVGRVQHTRCQIIKERSNQNYLSQEKCQASSTCSRKGPFASHGLSDGHVQQ